VDDWSQGLLAPDIANPSLLSTTLFDDSALNDGLQVPDMATSSHDTLFPTTSTNSHDSFLLANLNFHYPPPQSAANQTPNTSTYHTPAATAGSSHPRGSPSSSYDSHSISGLKRKSDKGDDTPDQGDEEAQANIKRQRNTLAARKYRQKRIDRITELEGELHEMTEERDDLRIRLARQEAETAALRSMLKMKTGLDA
jgi:hypothetical protein